MSKKTLYPNSLSQSSGNDITSFNHLANLKNNTASYAITDTIAKKSGKKNKPASITAKNFKANIPAGSKINKITVEYAADIHEGNISIGKPTIDILNITGDNKKGKALTKTMTKSSATWNGDHTIANVNNSDFGVKISFPANTKDKTGKIKLKYIRIIVDYTVPNYSVAVKKVSGKYKEEEHLIKLTLSNVNKTKNGSNVNIQLPSTVGFIYKEAGDGYISQTSSTNLTWVTYIGSKASASVVLRVYPSTSGNHIIRWNETGSNHKGSYTLVCSNPPSGYVPPEEEDDTPQSIDISTDEPATSVVLNKLVEDEGIDFSFHIDDDSWMQLLKEIYDYGVSEGWFTDPFEDCINHILQYGTVVFKGNSDIYLSKNHLIYWKYSNENYYASTLYELYFKDFDDDKTTTITIKGVDVGYDEIYASVGYVYNSHVYYSDILLTWKFLIIPQESSLTTPFMTLLQPTTEETHRLGDEKGYTVQSNVKVHGKTIIYDNSIEETLVRSSASDSKYKILATLKDLPEQFTLEFKLKQTSGDGFAGFEICAEDTYEENPLYSQLNNIFAGFASIDDYYVGYRKDSSAVYEMGGTLTFTNYNTFRIEREGTSFKYYVNDTLVTTKTIDWFDTHNSYHLILNADSTGTAYVKDILLFEGDANSDAYVRDWYKNFRIGVFNNPIKSNFTKIATFGTVANDSVTASLTLPETIESYTITSDFSIDTTETTDSITFDKVEGNEQVHVKIDYLDDEENIAATEEYYIDFEENTVTTESYNYDPTDYTNISETDIFSNAEYWGETVTALNVYQSLTCEFPYNKKYPLFIILTGDYPEGNPDNSPVRFTEPCIIESDEYQGPEENGNYPVPILSLIDEDSASEEPANIQLNSFEESTHVILYNPQLPTNFGTNDELAVRGIQITADIDFTDDLILLAKLKVQQDNQVLIGNRSVVINSNDDSIDIGGTYDNWGLELTDLINLDQLELELSVNNILEETDANILLKNIQLTIYSNTIIQQGIGVTVEGQDVAWYGMNVNDIEVPFGRNTETKYLNVEGTDTNIPYRQNIKEKIIKLHFDLDGCDLNETTQQLQQLAKLFTNERDELNSPIPKSITFSHLPGKVFYYILEETFDTDIQISDYKGTIELTIPDGTAFDIEDTVANVTGYVEGIAAVNPIITITHITNSQIVISEVANNPNQEFKLNNDNLTSDVTFETNDTIIINCLNRTCSITKADETESIDISEAVDFNSDWFKLHGEFEFIAGNCVIQTVTYNTRS